MPKFAANLSMMFNEVPFLERFAAAAEQGFSAVEFLFPYEHPAELLAEKLREHGLQQVLSPPANGGWRRCRAASKMRALISIARWPTPSPFPVPACT